MADNINGIFGGYSPTPDLHYIQTPRQGLRSLATFENYAPGCINSNPKCMDYDSDGLKQAVTGADIVVVCLGTGTFEKYNSIHYTRINVIYFIHFIKKC